MAHIRHDSAGNSRLLSTRLWRHISEQVRTSPMGFPGLGLYFADDFEFVDTDRYVITGTGTGTPGTFVEDTSTTEEGGFGLASVGATDGSVEVQSFAYFKPEAGFPMAWEIRLEGSTLPADLFVGLATKDTTVMSAGALTATEYIGFTALSGNDLTFTRLASGGSGQSSSSTVGTLVDGTAIRLGFRIDHHGEAVPYVDGVAVEAGRLTGSDELPTGLVCMTFSAHSDGTGVASYSVDGWNCAKDKTFAHNTA